MTTIYVKSLDEKTVGIIQIDPRHARHMMKSLTLAGVVSIEADEFKALKARIMRDMLQKEEAPRG